MTSQKIILDLDTSNSIKDLGIEIDTKYLPGTIYKLIEIIKKFGENIGPAYRDTGDVLQYILSIKYLNNILPITFEFDYSSQYINVVFYSKDLATLKRGSDPPGEDQAKSYLKLFLSIIEEPMIKYIENDHTGVVPSYDNDCIKLKPGEYLMNFVHCFLSWIGFDRVRLDDDSHLITLSATGDVVRTKLWLYSLLTKNKSWYAKFGYEAGNPSELAMIINDVKSIKLNDIHDCLKKVSLALNKEYLDQTLIDTSNYLIDLIGNSTETLGDYTKNHTLVEFTNLTNSLVQSIYSKKFSILLADLVAKSQVERMERSNNEPEGIPTTISFPWFDKCKQLFVLNVCQINNNIKNSFHK